MSVEAGDDIGEKTHEGDRILIFVAGTLHNFLNTGGEPMKLHTIYAPPEEEVGVLHHTKAEAAEEEK